MSAAPQTILFPFSGDSVGGSHISSTLIAKNLSDKFEPLFILSEHSKHQEDLLQEHDLPYEVRPDLYVPRSLKALLLCLPVFIGALLKARTFLKDKKIALVHCDNGPAQYLWFYASLLAGIPYMHVQRNPLRLTLERRIALRHASAVVSNSRFTQSTLPPLPETVRQAIIPPLVEIAAPPKRAKNDKAVIGFLSNMQKRKRPELFLEIARLLKNHAPDQFKFIMAGAFYDDYEARLKTLAQHYNLENDLTFTGFVNDPQKILAGFDILIAPAENEAFGRVLVEAMALGVPVIASKSGGHVEIIEDGKTGFLCTPDEAQSFADKVITLQNDAALKERITEAALAESKKYEASEIARRFEEIYEGVLS